MKSPRKLNHEKIPGNTAMEGTAETKGLQLTSVHAFISLHDLYQECI